MTGAGSSRRGWAVDLAPSMTTITQGAVAGSGGARLLEALFTYRPGPWPLCSTGVMPAESLEFATAPPFDRSTGPGVADADGDGRGDLPRHLRDAVGQDR